jgi:hypothetical protein
MQSTWEEAHSTALRELVEKGVPFSEIARALNERFGTAYTRNAAIGRARRMGLSVPERPGGAGPFPAAKKPDAKRIREKRARNLLKSVTKPATLNAPPCSGFVAWRLRRGISRWSIWRRMTAAILTAAMRKESPSPFAAIRAAKAPAIAISISI